jgi:hypothetical protein
MTKVFKQFTLAITLLISFLTATLTQAQNPKDTIRVAYSVGGNSYYMGDKKYLKSEIRDILNENPSSQKLVQSYSTHKTWGYISLAAGTLLTGAALYSIWDYNTDNVAGPYYSGMHNSNSISTSVIIAALAVVVDFAAINQLLDSNKKFNRAIKAYNKNSLSSNLVYDFYIGYNRIGVVVVFN